MIFLLQAICAGAAFGGIVYCGFALWVALCLRNNRRESSRGNFVPPVSVLKPLCGVDPHAYESLKSHCVQNYPNFEIIFGIGDADDPVVSTLDRLKMEFPQVPIQVVVCSQFSGMNLKI